MRATIKADSGDGIRVQVDVNISARELEESENSRLLRACVRSIALTFGDLPFSDFGIENIETELHPKQKAQFK